MSLQVDETAHIADGALNVASHVADETLSAAKVVRDETVTAAKVVAKTSANVIAQGVAQSAGVGHVVALQAATRGRQARGRLKRLVGRAEAAAPASGGVPSRAGKSRAWHMV